MSEETAPRRKPFDGYRALLQVAGFAGSVLRYGLDHLSQIHVQSKSDSSPVSWADLGADAVLLRLLREAFPAEAVYSEESPPTIPVNDESYWLVDPLDCTREYLNSNPHHFCVTFARMQMHRGVCRPVIGVIHDPISGDSWLAAEGNGAWHYSCGDMRQISCQPSDKVTVLVENASSRNDLVCRLAQMPQFKDASVIPQGSALKCQVLLSTPGSIYVRPTPQKEWDVAALALICSEANMRVSDFVGDSLRFNSPEWTLPRGLCCLPAGVGKTLLPVLKRLYESADSSSKSDRLQ